MAALVRLDLLVLPVVHRQAELVLNARFDVLHRLSSLEIVVVIIENVASLIIFLSSILSRISGRRAWHMLYRLDVKVLHTEQVRTRW